MVKAAADPEVLVLGSHPCAHLAAALLRQNSSIRVTRADVAGELLDDRLVVINAEFFDLNPLLAPLKKKLELAPFYGLQFLADDAATKSEFTDKSVAAYVGSMKPIRAAFAALSDEAGVDTIGKSKLDITGLDEHGIQVRLDGKSLKPKLLIIATNLSPDAQRMLGLPVSWENGVVHRYTYVKCKSPRVSINGSQNGKPLMPMSLDLKGHLTWAWAISGAGHVQFAVEQPVDTVRNEPPVALLHHWLRVLEMHGVIKSADAINTDTAISIDLPLAVALAQEGVAESRVADRTGGRVLHGVRGRHLSRMLVRGVRRRDRKEGAEGKTSPGCAASLPPQVGHPPSAITSAARNRI